MSQIEPVQNTVPITRHDLNNQIMRVIVQSEFLRRKIEDGCGCDFELLDLIRKIQESANEAADLSRTLFDVHE